MRDTTAAKKRAMSARLEGYNDFNKTASFHKVFAKTQLERFQKDSKRLADISSMLADSSRNCDALMSAADSNRKSGVPTMSAALSCQCDGPINCVAIQILLSATLNIKTKICDMKP